MKKQYSLYALCVKQTGEVFYIGQTTKNIETRLKEHLKEHKRKNFKFKHKNYKILKEQKIGNIIEIFKILSYNSKEELNTAEIKYIEWCKDIGIKLTNLTEGGDGTLGKVWSKEERERRSIENAFLGVTGADHPTSIPVIQYSINNEFIKEWENQTEAAKFFKTSKSNISSCCNGSRNAVAGFRWAYKEGYARKNHPKTIKEINLEEVKQLLLDGKTLEEISNIIGVGRHTISRRIKNLRKEWSIGKSIRKPTTEQTRKKMSDLAKTREQKIRNELGRNRPNRLKVYIDFDYVDSQIKMKRSILSLEKELGLKSGYLNKRLRKRNNPNKGTPLKLGDL